jgi:hypothetical protein
MEAIAQDAVLIPLGKEARVVYIRYSKAGAMRFASLIPAGGSLQIGFA